MERVQLQMERMLPELRDLEQKKVFTPEEISTIVAKRRRFETGLVRRDLGEDDFLDYVEYEKKLEMLRRKRVKRLKSKGKPSISTYSIPNHILKLYISACRRFPSSLPLWRQYISFVLSPLSPTSPKLVSRALASAISSHPTIPEFWMMAARWESDGAKGLGVGRSKSVDEVGGGGNPEAARKLLMRALRFESVKSRVEVWVEWVRIEVGYAEMVRRRWEVINERGKVVIDGGMDVDGERSRSQPSPGGDDSDSVQVPLLAGESGSADGPAVSGATEAARSGHDRIMDGEIVKVVLQNAFQALPGDQSKPLFTSLLTLLRQINTSLTQTLTTFLFDILRSSDPQTAWSRILIARKPYDELPTTASDSQVTGSVGEVVDGFMALRRREGVSVEVWTGLLVFLDEVRGRIDDVDLHTFIYETARRTYKSVIKNDDIDITFAINYLDLLIHLHPISVPSIHTTVRQLCERFEGSEEVWRRRFEVERDLIGSELGSGSGREALEGVMREARRKVPWSAKVWDLWLSWVFGEFSGGRIDVGLADRYFEDAVLAAQLPDSRRRPVSNRSEITTDEEVSDGYRKLLDTIYGHYVTYKRSSSPSALQTIYSKLTSLKNPSPSFWKWCISTEPETNVDNLSTLHRIRTELTSAGDGADGWLARLGFEVRVRRDGKGAAEIFKRALGRLGDEGERERLRVGWSGVLDGVAGVGLGS